MVRFLHEISSILNNEVNIRTIKPGFRNLCYIRIKLNPDY